MSRETLTGRRVLVTGGAGFIGSRLRRRLHALGAEVHATSRRRAPDEGETRWLQADLGDPGAAAAALAEARPEVVFHLASRVEGGRDLELVGPTMRDTLVGTVNLLTAATEQRCRRVVLAGSMEEASNAEADVPPSSPYAAAKSASTLYARMFRALYELPVVTLRIFMVYGPGQQEPRLIPYVIGSFARGEQPRLTSGTRAIDWVYVDDVVEAFVAAAAATTAEGTPLDVGSGTKVTIRELVSLIAAKMDADLEPVFGALPDRPLETSNVADLRATERVLGWRPATSLEEGLEQTIAWLAGTGDGASTASPLR
jgi:UDP-glucose 4-epimerase